MLLTQLYTMRKEKCQFCLICMSGAARSNHRVMSNMFKPSTLLRTQIVFVIVPKTGRFYVITAEQINKIVFLLLLVVAKSVS